MSHVPEPHAQNFLSGGGALSGLIRAFDWSATPLGPVDHWPQSLKTTVSLMLNSRHPMWVGWGPDATFLYNEAYISVLSLAKHPWALGRPAAEVWSEIWDVCGPLADRVFQQGEASFLDDVQLFMKREDFVEEVFYSFSYSPVRDESGRVGGLFCPSAETTGNILSTRRLATLARLAAQPLNDQGGAAVCRSAMATLADAAADIPFALLYLAGDAAQTGPEGLRLEQSFGIDAAANPAGSWPLAQALASADAMPVVDLAGRTGIPMGLAGQRVNRAAALPLAGPHQAQPLGVLVAGISPARPLDREYSTFLSLVAAQLATAIQNANAAEEERRRADALAQLDLAKTAFFSNVSHEFRTPLTLMLGPLDDLLAQARATGDAPSAELLELTLRNGHRLHRLVNKLLDFSRIEAGRAQASYEPTDLPAYTAELASVFRSAVEKAGLRLEIDCPPLPAPLYLDREMWEKVILNLLSNAFKYTLQGAIRVRVRAADGHATVTVSDTGAGIPPHELPKLFDRFHRVAGTPGRTHEGTGIGLALVQELVRLHGGTIEARSVLGQGSSFTVTLPQGNAHLPADRLAPAGAGAQPAMAPETNPFLAEALRWLPGGDAGPGVDAPAPPGTDLSPVPLPPGAVPGPATRRVLLADDNADMREYVGRLLRGQGYEVIAVADGAQALIRACEQQPDLILSDVMMPEMDGFALLKALRAEPQLAHTPVILLSARAGQEARVEGLRAGADDYLTKPFSARELVARVDGTLALAQARHDAIRREEELRAETAGVLESITEGFLALDRDWRFTYLNAEAERLNGVRRDEVLGRNHWDVYPDALGTEVERAYREVMRTRQPCHFEHLYIPWDRWFEINVYPMSAGGIAVYFRDITIRHRAEQAAREADRRKDEFLATLAHELRNPLAPIRSGLQIVRMAPHSAAAVGARDVMERQVDHMVRLIDDLMDVARISQGKLELRRERLDLRAALQSAVESSRPFMDAGRHAFTVLLPDHPIWADADPTRVSQTVANLLNNAAKYTPEGGRVTLTVLSEGPHAVITVTDTGVGISQDVLPRVFDMFAQGSRTLNRAQGGLGIGLTLVRQFVEMHGGSVSARSEGEGRGSVFTVRLPVEQALPEGAPRNGHASLQAGARKRVLVVDDNVDGAQTLATLLEILGHESRAVHDGEAAIEACRAFAPQAVFLDIGMPRMDGYEVARRLRAQPPGVPLRLVAMTGWGSDSDRARSKDAGFDMHLTKPIDVDAVEAALRGA